MIAACPKCQTRYRVGTEQLGSDGARLRCSQCSAVFRVRLPQAPEGSLPSPPTQDERLEHPASDREAIARSEAKPSEVNRRAAAQQDPIARSEAKPSEVNRRAAAQQDPIAR
ncbi:MAG TPA: MJ0042-type zinc finger domain-containing protein, partial [Myxococcota bacterium]|nr:MJ0042-type zinc finger domain-containing protein [Myxococcota bacterium]